METDSVPGRFVRAPLPVEDKAQDMFSLNGKGRKRQMSESEESDEESLPVMDKKSLIKPSLFNNLNQNNVNKMDDEDNEWKVVNKKNKKQKVKVDEMEVELSSKSLEKSTTSTGNSATNGSNSFRERLVESLKGSRFRFLNEQLYKCEGQEAKDMFEKDPQAFSAYHEGYRQQVSQWPSNPLDRIIKNIKKLPISNIIVDFGCGEARLAQEVPQEVHSLDLVASKPEVIACDMAHTPLQDESVDIAVFCLSLMGTNLKDFLLEANRVLKPRGVLKIAEVASRFENTKYFISNVERCGFTLQNKDLNDKLFYYFTFKKVKSSLESTSSAKNFSLKPCLYKKR